ncbi:hypothetical protein ACUY1T_09655 [Billgrantia sp. Q4P2]|uniref:hypothetical protein n=1 Tax=Billgrantia sp. Q4P2 TaxID=3463857 RepID=UPI004055BF9E
MKDHIGTGNYMSLNPENSVRLPLGRVTQAANLLLVRTLEGLFPLWGPLIFGICSLAGILLMATGSPIGGFLLIISPFGVLLALGIVWLLVANHMVMLFGEHDSGRKMAMFVLVMFVLPVVLLIAVHDTLLIRSTSSSVPGYVLAGMVLGLMLLGPFGVDQVVTLWPHRIGLLAHTLNVLLILAMMEIAFPYQETLVEDVRLSSCRTVKSSSRTGVKLHTLCLARFELDGKDLGIWLAPSAERGVRVRHGLFEHYRAAP